jgi:hypothetical protein
MRKETLERIRRGEITVRPHDRANYAPGTHGAEDRCTQCDGDAVQTFGFPARGASEPWDEARCVDHGYWEAA